MKREEIILTDENMLLNLPLVTDIQEKVTGVYGTPYDTSKVYIDSTMDALYVNNMTYDRVDKYAASFDLSNTDYPTRLVATTTIGISYDVYPTKIGHSTINNNKIAYPIKFGQPSAVYAQSLGIRDIVSNPTGVNCVTKNQWNTMNYIWNLNTGALYTSNGTYSANGTRVFSKSGTNSTMFGLFITWGYGDDESVFTGWIKNLKVWKIE